MKKPHEILLILTDFLQKKSLRKLKMPQINEWPTYIGFFIVSLAVLAYEVVLNRLFALMFWYHFAFMIISIALFGIGFGGMLIFFLNRFLKKNVSIVLAVLSIALAFFIPYTILKANLIPLNMDLLGKDQVHTNYFIQLFLTLAIPFALSGLIFSFVFTNYKNNINKIYFFDLFGGGVGCIFALLVFPGRGPFITAFILSMLLIAAAVFFAFKKNKIISLLILPLFALNIYFICPKLQNIETRVAKGDRRSEIDQKSGKPGKLLEEKYGKRVFAQWDNFGFVAVHQAQPYLMNITADYSCFTPLVKVNKNEPPAKYNFNFFGDHLYPYVITKKIENAGIIGVGGGKDILMALKYGAKNIYGAEINKTIFDLYDKIYSDFIGDISKRPNVFVYPVEGRFFIRSSKIKYDVLIFDNAVAQTAVSSGAFTIAESYIYTVEAMKDYIEHLSENGVIYFSNPYTDAERFVPVIRQAFKDLGRENDFKNSIFVADNLSPKYQKCKVLVKNQNYTQKDIANLVDFTRSVGHRILYAPYYTFANKSYVYKLVTTDDIEKEYKFSQSEIRPTTDDWPFFTQRVKQGEESLNEAIWKVKQFYPEPFLLLREATKNVAKYSFLFLILPLLFLNLRGFKELKNKLGSMIYFLSLGLGFMFIEIVLMQKYMLILGHPVYSFSIILAGLLISSGIGSLVSDRFESPYKAIVVGLAGILISTIISYLVYKFTCNYIVGLDFIWRVIITLILVSSSGIFMGFMMPSGIRALSKTELAIPWMWSVNSVFSVVASFFSIYLSIIYGFSTVLLLAVAVYGIGTAALIIKRT